MSVPFEVEFIALGTMLRAIAIIDSVTYGHLDRLKRNSKFKGDRADLAKEWIKMHGAKVLEKLKTDPRFLELEEKDRLELEEGFRA